MQKEAKDNDSEFESLVFWVFLHDSVNQALGKSAVCMKSHCIRALIQRVPVTFAKIKCGRGSAKDLISLQDSRTRSYKENVFLKNASND